MGLASFPLCFDLYTTLWFNNLAVTTDVPPPDVRNTSAHHSSILGTQSSLHACYPLVRYVGCSHGWCRAQDLETYFEVGMWSWGWMEPPLGQLSFFLLCIQFSREQLDKLQYKTYFQTLKDKRADGLCELYPQYHE